jgi:NADH-quinone oxidoreductase subunit J
VNFLSIAGLTPTQSLTLVTTVLAAVSLWLLLPRGGGRFARSIGVVLGLVSLGLFVSRLSGLTSLGFGAEGFGAKLVFWVLAAITVISAVGAVTMRSPVYCAIWFAMTLLGTAGLFLFQGAQFLGVATIVVYAGAILVTFLFVLMLAQSEGHAYYDRVSWEGLTSAAVGAVMIGVLTMIISDALAPPTAIAAKDDPAASIASAQAPLVDPTTEKARAAEILSPQHMDHLGAQLFSKHLIAVEVAGTLLLVALVGAVAIAIQGKQMPKTAGGARHG